MSKNNGLSVDLTSKGSKEKISAATVAQLMKQEASQYSKEKKKDAQDKSTGSK